MLGGGSWGTTVGSLLAPKHDTVLWARNPDVVKSIATDHVNPVYLPGFELASELAATSDLEEAVSEADLLVVGVPTSGSGPCSRTAGSVRDWIPVVSLSKGLEPGSLLRMTEVIRQVIPAI